MKKSTTAQRLKELMAENNFRQVDIINMCKPYCDKYGIKMGRSDISQYLSGKSQPMQEKLIVLSLALNVSEAWLMGYDVPKSRTVTVGKEKPVSDSDLKVALFGADEEVTDEMWDKVKEYADYIKNKYGK